MTQFAKLTGPRNGRGKCKVTFGKAWHCVDPEDRLSVLNQAMRILRDEHRQAEREARLKRQHEDAAWANHIRARA